jgi:hypothetical protein
MKILIGRHNGIGDIIMAAPFIATYLELGHDVTITCDVGRHTWLTWVFPKLKVIGFTCDPYQDFRETVEGFDVYLNLNNSEHADGVSVHFNSPPINQQAVYAFLAKMKHLPLPTRGLSPSRYISYPSVRGNETILFSQSTHPSRNLPPALVEQIRARIPDLVVNPPGDLIDLSERIARAKQVIGVDSGGIHLAEAFSTPWRVLHTTFDFETRHAFYEYGDRVSSLQANTPCSPCRSHSGCDNIICTSAFDLDAIVAPIPGAA